MKRIAFLGTWLLATPAQATLAPAELSHATAAPPADTRLPAALPFTEVDGRRVRLGAAAGGLPTVLFFVDYTCGHICGPGLTLTAGALADAGLRPGRDVALVTIGIDPKDRPADARAMVRSRLGGLPEAARAIHALTGDAATIAAAERALGYRAVYDPATDQFAHDAAVYVFARDGRLVALLPEMAQQPAALRAAIIAPAHAVGVGLVGHIANLCYGFAAAHGRYGKAIVGGLQAGAAVMLLVLGFALVRLRRARA